MRILFQLPYSGYLRMYGSTVGELAARGHTVELAYDSDKLRDASAAEIEAQSGLSIVDPVPTRKGRLVGPADQLRFTADYLRYLHPAYADAQPLRRRMDRYLHPRIARLADAPTLPAPVVDGSIAALRAAARRLPAPPQTVAYLSRRRPDCVLVTPVVGRGQRPGRQADTLLAARKLGIPAALAVSSWDHLTSKGLIKGDPERVLVWNEAQKREAVELHKVAPERVVITGAQLFDRWFDLRPTLDHAAFAASVGLPAGPYIAYVGSSPNIAPFERELTFVRRWIAALREHPALRDAGVLVRPHPGNMQHWAAVDLADLGAGAVAVAPRSRPDIPMSAADEALYFHTLHHSAAIVGINTSAMIEAAIVGRPVHTLRAPEFADTQDGTLHFRLLIDADAPAVRLADALPQHLDQLAEAVADPEAQRARAARFLETFVRPHGLDRAATPIVADAVERLAGEGQSATRS